VLIILKLGIFLLGTAGLVNLSWRPLHHPRSHGFPRFFAFEAILGLTVLNVPYWFSKPFSVIQLISWALLVLSAVLVISAIRTLRYSGAPDASILDPDRISFEKTTQVATTGPYRFIRHPMYASLLLLSWGVFVKHITLLSGTLVIIASLALVVTAIWEERENLANFGGEYAGYMQTTWRFIPRVF
jgi:protein-S-isoprenylcysteine O-methyltransferase Ste14